MVKRPASSTSGGLMKRPARDPIARDCNLIASALQEIPSEVPEQVREMLAAELTNCFVVKEDRHAYQEKVIGMVKETLEGMEASFKGAIAEADAKVASADTEKSTRDAALADAKAVHDQKVQAVAAAKEKLAEAKTASKASDVALKEAQASQKAGDADLNVAQGKKEKIEAFNATTLANLKESNVGGTRSFEKSCKEFGIDASEIRALCSALSKEPSTRGTFDAMVVQKLEQDLAKMLASLNDTLSAGEPAKQERANAVATCLATQEACHAAVQACVEALGSAEGEEKDAKAVVKEKQANVDAFEPEMTEIKESRDDAATALGDFQAGALTAFGTLVSRSSTPPEPEPAPAEAAEPAAEAGAA